MFDCLRVKCPVCKSVLEFQSKSGECLLNIYNKSNLTPIVAYGMNGDIVRCDKCKNRIQFKCKIPSKVKSNLVVMGKKGRFDYPGNIRGVED